MPGQFAPPQLPATIPIEVQREGLSLAPLHVSLRGWRRGNCDPGKLDATLHRLGFERQRLEPVPCQLSSAGQVVSSAEPRSIASTIWSACGVLGSSRRSAATNSSRLVSVPRTSSNEAKYASASAIDSLTAFGSSLSTKETIHWMQSSRATTMHWSRSSGYQSRRMRSPLSLGHIRLKNM